MSNHLHYLLFENTPPADPNQPECWPDEIVLRRIKILKGKKETNKIRKRWETWRDQELDEAVEEEKATHIRRMHDVSEFMKIVKQEIAQWYNREYDRTGHFWGGRFKSVLVQENHHFLLTVAAYIELNPVRAGMVEDPNDYPHSSYGAAVGGCRTACERLEDLYEFSGDLRLGTLAGEEDWEFIRKRYRKSLFQHGVKKMERYGNRKQGRAGFKAEEIIKVLEADGELSWREMVRPKLHYLVHGVVIGNEGFVASLIDWTQDKLGAVRERAPKPTPIDGLCVFRGVKSPPDPNPSPT